MGERLRTHRIELDLGHGVYSRIARDPRTGKVIESASGDMLRLRDDEERGLRQGGQEVL